MMGSGKTTVGKMVAERLDIPFMDTDSILQQRLGRPTAQLFKMYGEQNFRDHETAVLRSLEPMQAVLATGGGIVIRDANWVELKRLGHVVYLDVAADQVAKRLEASKRKRPLLEREDWKEFLVNLMEQRRSMYQKADSTIVVQDDDFEKVVGQVIALAMEVGEGAVPS